MCRTVKYYEGCRAYFGATCDATRSLGEEVDECAESEKKGKGPWGCGKSEGKAEERCRGTFQCRECEIADQREQEGWRSKEWYRNDYGP